MREIKVVENILKANDEIARDNREKFKRDGTLVLNLVSSPGAGKTALLERTLAELKREYKCAVIEGDIETTLDAERIQSTGVPVVQLNTKGACHLEAGMVKNALLELGGGPFDLIFIENVGNLVCPAGFDLGEHHKVTICSFPEGADKPLKYPSMFVRSSVVLLNKSDLAPHLFSSIRQELEENTAKIVPHSNIFTVSAVTGDGLDKWYSWIRNEISRVKGNA